MFQYQFKIFYHIADDITKDALLSFYSELDLTEVLDFDLCF